MMKNRVIIWGVDDYNTLALIRQIGQGEYDILFLIVGKARYAAFSKYCTSYIETQNVEDGYNVLVSKYADRSNKPIIVTNGDDIITFIDVHNDELSKAIKEKYDNVYIILSITRNSTIEEIMNFDIYTYDKICLPFEFNRKLDLVEQLSDKFEYSILCNSSCLWNCKERQNHWFHRGKENLLDMQYKECRRENISSQQRIYISPVDLSYFDCKINSYKLLDRINPSLKIFSSLPLLHIDLA